MGLSNHFFSYDNCHQWSFQDPTDGGTLVPFFRPCSGGTSHESVPEKMAVEFRMVTKAQSQSASSDGCWLCTT
jgi:hypothetical protein